GVVGGRYAGTARAGRHRAASQPVARTRRRRPPEARWRLRCRGARGHRRRAYRRGFDHPAGHHADRAAPDSAGCRVTELAVLQAVRLKGRVRPADLAATLDRDPGDIAAIVERLTAS